MDETREKVRRLRRYGRKDYSQLVDFPVEIVGRDGVVRQYSFDESVRLYQRRIASAALRYGDGELVTAEQGHCRQRIAQLRRSYLARYGWSAIRVVDSPGLHAGEFAGELAAFLRRVTERDEVAPEDLELAFIEEGEDHQLYYVRTRDPDTGAPEPPWLLYLYRFARSGSCPGRDAFFGFLKVLQGVQRGPGAVERLIAFHHTGDCGLILTGQGGPAAAASPLDEINWLALGEAGADPLRDGMAALRRGKPEQALARFVSAFEAQPFRRPAYVGAVVVADRLGARSVGETAALMGTAYFPDDAVLLYHLAVLRLREGELAGARSALARLAAVSEAGPAVAVLGGLIDLRAGRIWRGARTLQVQGRALRGRAKGEDQDLLAAIELVGRGLVLRRLALGVGMAALVAGSGAALVSGWWAICAGLGLASLPVIHAVWRRHYAELLAVPGAWGLQLANPADIRSAGGALR